MELIRRFVVALLIHVCLLHIYSIIISKKKQKQKRWSLYYASTLINNESNHDPRPYYINVYIIDGQNITQIKEYIQLNNTNKWNPCIPKPFGDDVYISITFADNKYNNFRDWYPLEICDYPYNFVNYTNKYLFDSGFVISII